jgi:hypothetical protein
MYSAKHISALIQIMERTSTFESVMGKVEVAVSRTTSLVRDLATVHWEPQTFTCFRHKTPSTSSQRSLPTQG